MNTSGRIYLDYAATTPVDQRVVDAMLPFFTNSFGNAASRNHSFGWEAEEAVEKAREQVATLIGASAKEIIFTSGSTESNNIAIQGLAEMRKEQGNHIITCSTEHKAVIDPCHYLEEKGFNTTFLGVDRHGQISLDELKDAITDQTILISLMTANNETGVMFPIAEIGKIAKEKGIIFHTDATQAVGKIPIDVNEMNIDLLSLSAHKLYGPKGIGALYVRRRNPRVRLSPVQHGGGHERGMRSGTLNVPGIVGLGAACQICFEEMPEETKYINALKQRLNDSLHEKIDCLENNGQLDNTIPGILNISFSYVEGESLMMGIEQIACSSGSACTSASLEPSYVLRAMGVGDELAHSSMRFSIGRFTTEKDIEDAADMLIGTVKRLRDMSPLYEMAKEGIDIASIDWKGH